MFLYGSLLWVVDWTYIPNSNKNVAKEMDYHLDLVTKRL